MYFVAYEHNELAGYYKGVRFWTSYPSKEAFEQSKTVPSHTVVAHGENAEEIKAVALDYDPNLLIQVSKGKIQDRFNLCLKYVDDKKRFTKELKLARDYAKMEEMQARFAVVAAKLEV